MSQYHIYQLPVEAGYAFRGWNETKDRFSINDYNKVYNDVCAAKYTEL